MESPMNRNPVVKAIAEALEEHRQMLSVQACGPSAETTIYHKLVEKGFIKEEHCKPKT